jgi:hypothetical protein
MTNDASRGGRPPASTSDASGTNGAEDWERAALERVAAQRVELQDTHKDDPRATTGKDWEQRALECLRRYFRTQR